MNNCGTGAKKFVVSFPRDCHAYAHNDKYFWLRPKRKLIRSVLINGLCNFEDEIGAARRRPHRTPSKTVVQVSKCVLFFALANEWHNKSDDTFLCECRLSSPRATDNIVEKALYTSGGRNTGAVRKDGAILLGLYTQNFCRAVN